MQKPLEHSSVKQTKTDISKGNKVKVKSIGFSQWKTIFWFIKCVDRKLYAFLNPPIALENLADISWWQKSWNVWVKHFANCAQQLCFLFFSGVNIVDHRWVHSAPSSFSTPGMSLVSRGSIYVFYPIGKSRPLINFELAAIILRPSANRLYVDYLINDWHDALWLPVLWLLALCLIEKATSWFEYMHLSKDLLVLIMNTFAIV